LDYAELVMELEKEFDITIPSSEASRITTVSQVIDYINRRIKSCKGLSNY
jgi:acyl carrier protein